MRRLDLVRFARTQDGVLGRLLDFCTLEEEWQDNQRRISCIPSGLYVCKPRVYLKGGYPTYEVTNVPGRSDILIHAANVEEHLEGCIAPGLGFQTFQVAKPEEGGGPVWKIGVKESRTAHKALMAELAGVEAWELNIVDYRA